MRDQNDGSISTGRLDGLANAAFADRVERGGSLVEDQDRRILQKHPCQSDTLLLAAREVLPALGDRL